jgi:hypothetical protein
VIPAQTKTRIVDAWLRHESLWLRLTTTKNFGGEHVDDYDEVIGHGYRPAVIEPADWRMSTDPKGLLAAEALGKVWTFEGGVPTSIYGYFLEGRVTGFFYWAEPFDEPVVITREGERLRVIARCVFPAED